MVSREVQQAVQCLLHYTKHGLLRGVGKAVPQIEPRSWQAPAAPQHRNLTVAVLDAATGAAQNVNASPSLSCSPPAGKVVSCLTARSCSRWEAPGMDCSFRIATCVQAGTQRQEFNSQNDAAFEFNSSNWSEGCKQKGKAVMFCGSPGTRSQKCSQDGDVVKETSGGSAVRATRSAGRKSGTCFYYPSATPCGVSDVGSSHGASSAAIYGTGYSTTSHTGIKAASHASGCTASHDGDHAASQWVYHAPKYGFSNAETHGRGGATHDQGKGATYPGGGHATCRQLNIVANAGGDELGCGGTNATGHWQRFTSGVQAGCSLLTSAPPSPLWTAAFAGPVAEPNTITRPVQDLAGPIPCTEVLSPAASVAHNCGQDRPSRAPLFVAAPPPPPHAATGAKSAAQLPWLQGFSNPIPHSAISSLNFLQHHRLRPWCKPCGPLFVGAPMPPHPPRPPNPPIRALLSPGTSAWKVDSVVVTPTQSLPRGIGALCTSQNTPCAQGMPWHVRRMYSVSQHAQHVHSTARAERVPAVEGQVSSSSPVLSDWLNHSRGRDEGAAADIVGGTDTMDQLRTQLLDIFLEHPELASQVRTTLLDELVEQLGDPERFDVEDVDINAAIEALGVLIQHEHQAAEPLLCSIVRSLKHREWDPLAEAGAAGAVRLAWLGTVLCVLRPASDDAAVAYRALLSHVYSLCLSSPEQLPASQSMQLLACMGASQRFATLPLLYTLFRQAEQAMPTPPLPNSSKPHIPSTPCASVPTQTLTPRPSLPVLSGPSTQAPALSIPFPAPPLAPSVPSTHEPPLLPNSQTAPPGSSPGDSSPLRPSPLHVSPRQMAYAILAASSLDKHTFPNFMSAAASFLAPSPRQMSTHLLCQLLERYASMDLHPYTLFKNSASHLFACVLAESAEEDDGYLHLQQHRSDANQLFHGKAVAESVSQGAESGVVYTELAARHLQSAQRAESADCSIKLMADRSAAAAAADLTARRLTRALMDAESARVLHRTLHSRLGSLGPIHVVAAITRACTLLTRHSTHPKLGDKFGHSSPRISEATELRRLLGSLECILFEHLGEHSAGGLAVTVWQWSKADYAPSLPVLGGVLLRIVEDAGEGLERLSAQEVVMLVAGLASSPCEVARPVWELLANVVAARADGFDVAQRVRLYWGLAQAGGGGVLPHRSLNLLRNELLPGIAHSAAQLQRSELLHLLNALQESRHRFTPLLESVKVQLEGHMGELTVQELSHAAFCLARLRAYSPPFSERLQAEAAAKLLEMGPADIGKFCWVLANPLQADKQQLVLRLQQRALQLLPHMSPHALSEVLLLSALTDSHHYLLFKGAAQQIMQHLPQLPDEPQTTPTTAQDPQSPEFTTKPAPRLFAKTSD